MTIPLEATGTIACAEVVARLRQALGERVIVDSARLAEAQADKSGQVSAHPPLCVIEATSTADVAEVLRIAHETKTPVVTRGGGSGLAGGAIAGAGEIVLSLARMNRIIEISRKVFDPQSVNSSPPS